jgi:chromosome segregation ATPase
MPEQSIDQLLTALESDLSEARGQIMRLEDVIGGNKIEISMLKEELRASDTELAMLRDEISKLAPQRPERRHAGIVSSAGMLKALKCHVGCIRGR